MWPQSFEIRIYIYPCIILFQKLGHFLLKGLERVKKVSVLYHWHINEVPIIFSLVLRTVKILLCKARFSSFSFEYTSGRYANVLSYVSLQRNNEKSLIIPLQITELFLKSKSFGVLYSWKAINFRMKTSMLANFVIVK